MNSNLSRLKQAAQMVQDSETLALAKLHKQMAELRQSLDTLQRPTGEETRPEAFARSGGQHLWDRWCLQKRAELNQELARLRVAEDRQKQKTARAIGRVQVLKKLSD